MGRRKGEHLKIAMFGHKQIPSRVGGIEVVVQELATRMAALGHQVTCYNRRGGTSDGTLEGVDLKSVPTWNKKGLAAVTSSFFAALRCAFSPADVVHIHGEGPAFMCWIPKLFGKRVVVTIHGLDWQREKWKNSFGAAYIHAGERMAVKFADEIIVLSRYAQAYFQSVWKRTTVWIPNGVNCPALLPVDLIRTRYGLEEDGYFLFLGRLVPEKGIHHLIEAYLKVHTDKKLVIAGCSSDTDSYVEELRSIAAGHPGILFTGFVQGRVLEELCSNAYVFVLPSQVEGMSMSLLEAMSYGNCCVVSDIPECTEVVEDRAVVCPVEELSGCLQKLCDDPVLVAEYKRNARPYICGKYNWDRVVAETLELYR